MARVPDAFGVNVPEAVVAPAGTVTVVSVAPLAVRVMVDPPAGAGALSVTETLSAEPRVRDVGEATRVLMATGLTVIATVDVAPESEATIDAVPVVSGFREREAVALPAGTKMVPHTLPFHVIGTLSPPVGAGTDSVTVAVTEFVRITGLGVTVKVLIVGGRTISFAVAVAPP